MWGKFSNRNQSFTSLNDKKLIALAINACEEDEKIFLTYATSFAETEREKANLFLELADATKQQRYQLLSYFNDRFGKIIPLVRRDYIRGFFSHHPHWLAATPCSQQALRQAVSLQKQTACFYRKAITQSSSVELQALFGVLLEQVKEVSANDCLTCDGAGKLDDQKKQRLLTWIQPGLAGLMDGSISTLAPIFAAAFATQNTTQTFLVGLSASLGAGISMGFTEAIHDDGRLSGRGSPIKRGFANGIMTAIGGLGHTLPYLIPHFFFATAVACGIVVLELFSIAWIQKKYMAIPFSRAAIQVILGGLLVLATGILIGNF